MIKGVRHLVLRGSGFVRRCAERYIDPQVVEIQRILVELEREELEVLFDELQFDQAAVTVVSFAWSRKGKPELGSRYLH